ncbi:basic proline-rich protein-like, partial [Canis lupus familiaris]|uniref:basic proline-rich protein-like n=1 Tax=Canis lupus familiaris TaxID=9615 RepID=UPI0018F72364
RAAPGRRPRLRTSASSPSRHRLRRLPQPCPDVPAGRSSAPSRAPPAAARRPPAHPTQPWLLRRHDRPPPPPPALGGALAALRLPGPRLPAGEPAPCPLPPPGSRAAVRRVSEEPVAASLPSGGPGWAGPSPHAPGRQGARARRGRAGGAGGRVDGGQDGPPRSPRASGRTGPGGGPSTSRRARLPGAPRAPGQAHPARPPAAASARTAVPRPDSERRAPGPAAPPPPPSRAGMAGEKTPDTSPLEAWVRIPLLTRPPFGPPNAGSPHPGLDDALSVPPYTPLRAAGRAAGCGLAAPWLGAPAPSLPRHLPRLSPSSSHGGRGPRQLGKSAARLSGGSVCPLPSRRRPLQASRGPKCRQPRAGRATLPLRGAPRSPPRSPAPPYTSPARPPGARGPHGLSFPPAPIHSVVSTPSVPGAPTRRGHPEASPRPHARQAGSRALRAPARDGTPAPFAGPGPGGRGGVHPAVVAPGSPERKAALPPRAPSAPEAAAGRGSRTPARSLTAPPASQPAGGRSAQAHLPASPPPQPSRPRRRAAGRAHTPFFGLLAWALLGGPHLRRRHRRRHAHTRTHTPPPTPRHPGSAHNPSSGPSRPPPARTAGRRAIRPWAFGGAPGGKGRSALSCAGHRRPALPGNRARVRLGQAAPPGRTVSGGGPPPGRGRRVSRVRLGASLGPWAPRAGPSPSPSPSPSPRRICTGAEPVLQTAGPPPAPAQRVLTTGRAGTTTSAAGEAVWWPPPPPRDALYGHLAAVSFKHGPLPTAKVTASTRSMQPSQHRRQHTQPRGTAPPPRLSPARRVHERRRTSMGITAKGTEVTSPPRPASTTPAALGPPPTPRTTIPTPAPAPAPAPGLPPPCQKQLYQQQQQQQQQQQRDVPTASRPA